MINHIYTKISRKLNKLEKDIYNTIDNIFRSSTKNKRALPDFIIVGAQKAGTTSLYYYLLQHPQILGAQKKEIHFFDYNYSKELEWYKKNFPLKKRLIKKNAITGEASPQYMFHPHTLNRIAKNLPNAKIIILLRNPIDRAYSYYHHQVKRGREKKHFLEAIKNEETRIAEGYKNMIENPDYNDYNYLMFSYLKRGKYYEQVKRCMELFPEENILILQSEKMYESPAEVYKETIDFLNLEHYELPEYKVYFSNKYDNLASETRNYLYHYFKPLNEKLFKLIGKRFDWK